MEPIIKDLGKIRGAEILYFDNAEVEKVKGNSTSFASFGPLSVVYFKDYNRHVLLLNDWKYPLLRRLPILGLDKEDAESRTYSLPARHGFAYNLKITKPNGSFALQNLDAILENNSRMTWKSADQAFRKAEESPDDHLSRHIKKEVPSGTISESIKHSIQNMMHKVETLKTGTKNLTSKKKRINQADIKTKDFRKDTHSKLNQSFFKSHGKQTSEFWQSRRGNLNNIVSRKYDDIRKLADGPSLYISREELEESILNNKDVGAQGLSSFHLALQRDEKPVISEPAWSQASTQPNSVTQSLISQGPVESQTRRDTFLEERNRDRTLNTQPEGEIQTDKLVEGMTHYQG